ncbi:M20/M25/M40 family metallo-hydrolase [Rummeliibacillus sp. NPDC094406]|uniref:M20/M25/M40 family metallo-hydrolase n=1 Tax=Rummeliibacillus sp. NPDC094406 TaxID=3364511 RepID=UPI0038050EB4
MRWNSPEKLRMLLSELVSWESQTLTQGEQQFSTKLQAKLQQLTYFEKYPEYLNLCDVDHGRQVVSALYKQENVQETVVLISHFDTVQIEEYGSLMPLATMPEELTNAFLSNPDMLNESAKKDLESGDYLFGRGVMDMKMGLALHMQMIERAIEEQWPINLLLVTVPDEEVNSAGMRQAVKHINELQNDLDLNIVLFLNSEPSFSQDPTDLQEYIYSGTIGKIMPAALFYGKETHVGEPLKGMTAPFMSAFLTTEMEWNDKFIESEYGEVTPLPVSLQLKDLKDQYSTQTPYRAVALYNVFLMKRSAEEIMSIFEDVANEAMKKCQSRYDDVCTKQGIKGVGKIRVLRFEELHEHAVTKLGREKVSELTANVIANKALDDREMSLRIADQLMIHCQELAPAVVLLFAPPYYPAANSSDNPLIQGAISLLLEESKKYNIPLQQIHYFNGICDLSYCQFHADKDWQTYEKNTPVWGKTYDIPLQEMAQFSAPVLNVGPFGKDAHQISERLHVKSAFEEMPELLYALLKFVSGKSKVTE